MQLQVNPEDVWKFIKKFKDDYEPHQVLVDMEDPQNRKFDHWTIYVQKTAFSFHFECDRSKVPKTKFEHMRKLLLAVRTLLEDQSVLVQMAAFRKFQTFVTQEFQCYWRLIEYDFTSANLIIETKY